MLYETNNRQMLKNLSTKNKLLCICLLQLIIFILFISLLLNILQKNYIKSIKYQHNYLANRFSTLIDGNLASLENKLKILGKGLTTYIKKAHIDINSDDVNIYAESLQQFLDNRILIRLEFPNELLILNSKGRLVAESPFLSTDRIGMDLSFRSYFKETIKLKAPYVSETYKSTGLKEPAIMVAVPVLEDDDVIAVLAANIKLSHENIINTIVKGLNVFDRDDGPSIYNIYICEGSGRILYHEDNEFIGRQSEYLKSLIEQFNRLQQNFLKAEINGEKHFFSIRKLRMGDFYLIIEQSLKTSYRTFHMVRNYVFIMSILFIVIFITSIITGITKVLKPLNRLFHHLKSLTDIDPLYYKEIHLQSENKEMQQLINTFNHIIVDIKERSKKLFMLEDALEYSAAGIIITDNDYRLIYVNRTFELISGYSKKELLGKDINILRDSHTSDEICEEVVTSLNKGNTFSGELYRRRKNGEKYIVSSQAQPVFDEKGKLKYVILTEMDITKKKLLNNKTST
jgi:PAS domain S-box-containing protein